MHAAMLKKRLFTRTLTSLSLTTWVVTGWLPYKPLISAGKDQSFHGNQSFTTQVVRFKLASEQPFFFTV